MLGDSDGVAREQANIAGSSVVRRIRSKRDKIRLFSGRRSNASSNLNSIVETCPYNAGRPKPGRKPIDQEGIIIALYVVEGETRCTQYLHSWIA